MEYGSSSLDAARTTRRQALQSAAMIDEADRVVVMEASPVELDRVAKRLTDVGIDSAIVSPPKGKGGS